MSGEADLDRMWTRLWQLLWTCCDSPRPAIVSGEAPGDSALARALDGVIVVFCDNCGAVH